MKKLILLIYIVTLQSCVSNNNSNPSNLKPDALTQMEVVFEGNSSKEEIQKLMTAVLAKYDMEVNEQNLTRCADVVVSLRKSSVLGVTEMEILKHIYQHGDNNIDFPTQAALSYTVLEMNK